MVNIYITTMNIDSEHGDKYLGLYDNVPLFKKWNDKKGCYEKWVLVCCEVCGKDRYQGYYKYKNRKTNMCSVCNGLNNLPVKPTHGLSQTRIYQKYYNMLQRCYNTGAKSFNNYGGRGIGVDMVWLGEEGFKNFYDWSMQNGWDEECKLQIDRIDNDGDYSPNNCQFITQQENLKKVENLFGRQKTPENKYADLVEKLSVKTNEAGEVLVPLWDWLENLGSKHKQK